MSVISTALSGLNAQSTALGAHADNIANIRSSGRVNPGPNDRTAYVPVKPVLSSVDGGGVIADVVSIDDASVSVFDPDSVDANEEGLVAYPDISLEEEIFGVLNAKNAYIANAKVIGVQRDMDKALLDIIA